MDPDPPLPIMLPPPTTGKRKVPAMFLSPPSSKDSWSSSSSSGSASITFVPHKVGNHMIDLPVQENSVPTLEHIGFNQETGTAILARWEARPDPEDNPDTLLSYALATIRPFKARDVAGSLSGWGLTEAFQKPFLDPKHEDIRETETLEFWVEDTLRLNHKVLLSLQERFRNVSARAACKRPPKKQAKVAPEAESTTTATPSNQTTLTLNMEPKDHNIPIQHTSIAENAPELLPGHTRLFKGKCADDCLGLINADGTINLLAIETYKGGDFNAYHPASYWTPKEGTAEKYRAWAEARFTFGPTWIIQIQVPDTFINTLTIEAIWYSRDFKEYVWWCRKGRGERMPSKFDKYQTADLLIGHICKSVNVPTIPQAEVQNRINENHLLLINNGQKAKQYVFMNQQTVAGLASAIKAMHISITPPLLATSADWTDT